MALEISGVSALPSLSFVAGGAGDAVHALVFSGSCHVTKVSAGMFGTHRDTRLGFYVPTAGPFRPSHLLSAWKPVRGLHRV